MSRVYKRDVVNDKRGYSPDRPWMVGATPEDSRETCWPSWEEAIGWATMPSEERWKIIEFDNKMDSGW